VCPCHGSVYSNFGEHLAGPAQRGLDPLPLRKDGSSVEVTWIEYKQGTPDHIVLQIG
jgi:Rieske Fe-S protein